MRIRAWHIVGVAVASIIAVAIPGSTYLTLTVDRPEQPEIPFISSKRHLAGYLTGLSRDQLKTQLVNNGWILVESGLYFGERAWCGFGPRQVDCSLNDVAYLRFVLDNSDSFVESVIEMKHQNEKLTDIVNELSAEYGTTPSETGVTWVAVWRLGAGLSLRLVDHSFGRWVELYRS